MSRLERWHLPTPQGSTLWSAIEADERQENDESVAEEEEPAEDRSDL
jgi:hypothetical protein